MDLFAHILAWAIFAVAFVTVVITLPKVAEEYRPMIESMMEQWMAAKDAHKDEGK
jgi:uncharacterized protein YoxC